MANKYFDGFAGFLARQVINSTDYFELTYKQGKGHFKVSMYLLITSFNQTEFKKVIEMIKTSDNPQVTAGYLNSIIKKIHADIKEAVAKFDRESNTKEYQYSIDAKTHLEKRNALLVKAFGVSDITVEKVENSPVTEVNEVIENEPNEPVANELITPLKKCNVIRFIPTQLNPIWKYGLIKSYVGYHFEYRGLPLQVYREDGWETKTKTEAHVFVIDPVIGLPVVSYYGLLAELEDKLSEVFIGYLKTLDSNKESIVQIANAFETLKKQTNNMTA